VLVGGGASWLLLVVTMAVWWPSWHHTMALWCDTMPPWRGTMPPHHGVAPCYPTMPTWCGTMPPWCGTMPPHHGTSYMTLMWPVEPDH